MKAETDDEKAMSAVVDSMGAAAKAARRKRHEPSPKPVFEAPADSDSGLETPSAEDFEKLLANE